MARGRRFGKTALNTKGIGYKICRGVKVNIRTKMEMFMRGSG
jgi:hypothetical protein